MYNIVFVLLSLSIFFSYFSLGGIRLIVPFIFSLYILLFFYKFKNDKITIKYSYDMIFYVIILFFIFCYSLLTSFYDIIFSGILFGLILYWPYFLNKNIDTRRVNDFLKIHSLFATILSIGVILQFFLFKKFGIEFGKLDIRDSRIGFGFIWLDFSFLSLYLVASIPLIYSTNFNIYSKLSLTFILVFGSFITTARTGLFSLLFILSFSIFIYLFFSIYKGYISRKISVFMIFLISLFSYFYLKVSSLSEREMTLDDNGRFDGYKSAINYSIENIFFGAKFNPDLYKSTVDVLPHNIFVYNLTMGGGVFFIFFVLWLIILYLGDIHNNNKFIKISFFICLIGMQFIPSTFSTFFFALIISMAKFQKFAGEFK